MNNHPVDFLVEEYTALLHEAGNGEDELLKRLETDSEWGSVAAKHIETMQRSNEQLVKIIGLQQKTQAQGFELSDVDKDNLFDMIQGGAED